MTVSASRIAALTAVATLGATALGCGVFSRVQQAASNLSTVTEVAQKLKDSGSLTYTAEYKMLDGATATVVQQPPNVAVIGKDGRFILTAESIITCGTQAGKTACQKQKNTSPQGDSTNAANAAYFSTAAGTGFISAPLAIGVLTVASLSPGATVEKSERTIAGQKSTCLKISGIQPDNDPSTPDLKEFSACVTDSGVLASFEGLGTDGKNATVELTRYSSSVDANAFKPPAGAEVTDLDQLKTPN